MHNQPEIFGCSEQQGQRNSKMLIMRLYTLVPHMYFMLLYRQHVRLEHLDTELVSLLPTSPSSKDSKALQERMWVCHAKLMHQKSCNNHCIGSKQICSRIVSLYAEIAHC